MAAVYENQSTDFYCRGDKNYRSQLHCSPHIHYHIEIVQILEGETIGYADTEEVHLEAGDIFISFPDQVHYFVTKKPERYRLFIVSPDLTPEFLSIFTNQVPRSALVKGAGLDPEIDALVAARTEAKKAKNWAEADRIRDELKARGIEIIDTPQGAKWKRV